MDSFFQLKAWIRTGVSPLGAQVRRTEGRCETPLSSWKTIQAFRRRAFFLLPAISPAARTAPFPVALPRLLGGPLQRPVDGSQNLPHMARVIAHSRSPVPSPPRPVAMSTDRCRSHATGPPAAMPSPPAAAVPGPASVCGRRGPRRAELRSHPAAIPRTSGSHSDDSLLVHARSLPESSSRQQTTGPPASAAAPILENPVVEIYVFACHHINRWHRACHCIMRDSGRMCFQITFKEAYHFPRPLTEPTHVGLMINEASMNTQAHEQPIVMLAGQRDEAFMTPG